MDDSTSHLDALSAMPYRPTAEEYVREALRDAILRGDMAVGTRLVQAKLAQQFGVSTTPIREALRALATEGLIGLDPHRGAIVQGLNTEEVRDIHSLRELLEPEVMRRAMENLTPKQLDEAEKLQVRMEGETDPGRWADLNRAFHRVFTDAAGSERLARMVTSLQDSYAAYIMTMMMGDGQRMAAANADHRAILDAARAGDVEEAIRCVLHHMAATVEHAERSEAAR